MSVARLIAAALALVAAGGAGVSAQSPGQAYPSQGVKIIVPFGAGSITDTLARQVADRLATVWGQNVTVENRPGLPGTTSVAKSAPDGYTLMLTSNGHVIAKTINKNVSFDPVTDFAGVIRVAFAPVVMVVPVELPVKSLKDFLELARAKPGALNFSSAGVASTTFLAAEVMRQAADIQMVHVPFKGVPEALTAVIRGDVQMYFAPVPDTRELTEAGKVRPIAVNSATRVPQLPDIPTVAESGLPGYKYDAWFGIMAPAATPRPIVEKINRDIAAILAAPELVERLAKQGSIPAPNTPAEFDAIIKADAERFAKVLAAAGIQAN